MTADKIIEVKTYNSRLITFSTRLRFFVASALARFTPRVGPLLYAMAFFDSRSSWAEVTFFNSVKIALSCALCAKESPLSGAGKKSYLHQHDCHA